MNLTFFFLVSFPVQTGWGTRSGIGDAATATAAADSAAPRLDNEKKEREPVVPVSPFDDVRASVDRDRASGQSGIPVSGHARTGIPYREDTPFASQVQISPFQDPPSQADFGGLGSERSSLSLSFDDRYQASGPNRPHHAGSSYRLPHRRVGVGRAGA
jgi:hypothetical protein